jgi:hypothetical protein
MRWRASKVPLAAIVGCWPWTVSQAAGSACPDVVMAANHAKQGHGLRRSGAVVDAVNAFEAAYRCMPPGTDHDARWEHLAALFDAAWGVTAGDQRDAMLCRMRGLVRDFKGTIVGVHPIPDSAAFADEALRSIEDELATGGKTCPAEPPAPTPVQVDPASSPSAPSPQPAHVGRTSIPHPIDRPTPAGRPLRIAGAAVGAVAVVPLAVMIAGLVKGGQAELGSAEAKAAGDLQSIRDELHPAGVVANRMAFAGAIVGGVLVVTSAALLVAAHRGSRTRTSGHVMPAGGGVMIRF